MWIGLKSGGRPWNLPSGVFLKDWLEIILLRESVQLNWFYLKRVLLRTGGFSVGGVVKFLPMTEGASSPERTIQQLEKVIL